MVIDVHTHVFDVLRGRTAEGNTKSAGWGAASCNGKSIQIFPPYCRETGFSPEALVRYLDLEGIDKAVLLQGCFYGDQNTVVREALRTYPNRFAGAMYLEPFADNAAQTFEENAACFQAVKLECSEATGFSGWRAGFDLGAYLPLFKEMERRKMTLVLDLGRPLTKGYQTAAVRKVIDAAPDLKIVICHLGQPGIGDDEEHVRAWTEQLELAKCGKVYFDTASLASYFSSEVYPYRSGAELFEIALNIVTPSRIMAGTDMPGNSLIASYKQMLFLPRLYGSILGLREIELEAIMGRNAQLVYFQ